MNAQNVLRALILVCLGIGVGFGFGRWSAPLGVSGEEAGGDKALGKTGAIEKGIQSIQASGEPRRDDQHTAGKKKTVSADLLMAVMRVGEQVPKGEDLFSQTDGAIEVLKITDTEKRDLQHAWRDVVGRVRVQEVEKAKITDGEDGAVLFVIEPLVEERAKLRQLFNNSARAILGDERAVALLAIKGGDAMLSSGKKPIELKVGVEESGKGAWQFRIEEKRGKQRKVWLADAIPADLKHLTDAAGVVGKISEAPKGGESE